MERMTNRAIERNGVLYFKCRKCGEVKPLNKCYFHINTMFSTGFNSKCKSCVKEERESQPKVKYVTRAELEEENKSLKEENDRLKDNAMLDMKEITKLEEENRKLKDKLNKAGLEEYGFFNEY